MLLLIIVSVFAVIILWNYYMHNVYSHFSRLGIDTPPYKYLFGNVLDQCLLKENMCVTMRDAYRSFKGYNYFGFYTFTKQTLVIRNPQIIRDILQKDFNHFTDNDMDIHEDADPIMGRNPFMLKGQKWKEVRSQLLPSFNVGKVKHMMPNLKENASKLVEYIKTIQNGKEVDVRDLSYRITTENVAGCGFGLNANCFDNSQSKFLSASKSIFEMTASGAAKAFLVVMFSKLGKIFKIRVFSEKSSKFIEDIVEQTLRYRKEHEQDEKRNDFLEAMKDLQTKRMQEDYF